MRAYLSLIRKGSVTLMHGHVVYVTEGLLLHGTSSITRKLWVFLFMFSTGFTSFSVLLLFPLSIAVYVFMFGF